MQLNENERPSNLVDAINYVMYRAKNVEKNLTVGTGGSSYSGVSDKDVKELLQPLLVEAGLIIVPINIDPTVTVNRWEVAETWNGREVLKQKMQVFTEVKVKYLLQHRSGESIELMSYGHGIDSQDKSAGKSTTYALKYLLIYTFLIPTGAIDDSDKTNSDQVTIKKERKTLSAEDFNKAIALINKGTYTAEKLDANYLLDKYQLETLNNLNT